MTFAELKQELADRGFDGIVTDTRMGLFVNRAIALLDGMYLWPYREATASGVVPLTIADLGTVQDVIDVTTHEQLLHYSLSEIQRDFGDETLTGSPEFWYVTRVSGSPVLTTFPVTSGQVTAKYWKTQPALSTGTDEPLAPDGYHLLIVDLAAVMAYKDSDNFSAAGALQADIDVQVARMVDALMDGYGPVIMPLDGVDC